MTTDIKKQETAGESGTQELRNRLFALQDTAYGDFHAKLIPNIDRESIIGVRAPLLRQLARDIIKKGKGDTVFQSLPHKYYEENNLHSFIISELKDYNRTITELNRFLPYVDNWATCDMTCPKAFKRKNTHKRLQKNIDRWLTDTRPFTVRFAIRMLMAHFLDDRFHTDYLERVAAIESEHYYVNMMVAWYFATALTKQYAATLPYIEQQRLPQWTHNKTIQKAVESLKITEEQKQYLRSLKKK